MPKSHESKVSLYDIKINSPYKDIILIKGSESEGEPTLLEGTVKLSISSNMHIKKVKLALIGEFNVAFAKRGEEGATDHIIERFCLMKIDWENLLTNENGEVNLGSYGDKPISMHKLMKHKYDLHKTTTKNSSQRPGMDRAVSQPSMADLPPSSIHLPKSGVDGTPFKNYSHHNSFLLHKGNYSLPFKVVLPANVSETIEGLSIGKILYRFESSIQRGIFEKPINKYKHVRIMRTLPHSSINFIDNIDIFNSWSGKIDYRVMLKRKAIPVGSTIPIKLLMSPLTKGLRIRKIDTEIVQQYSVNYITDISPTFEQTYGKQTTKEELDPSIFSQELWDITYYYKVPDNLRQITQSCHLYNSLVISRHRIRIAIQIKNASGHVSELRANIPITLYVNPNVGHVYGGRVEIDEHQGYFNVDRNNFEPLFKKDTNSSTTSLVNSSQIGSPQSGPAGSSNTESDLEDESDDSLPPPVYENYKFDKLFDMSSPKSPQEQLHGANSLTSYFDIPTPAPRERNSSSDINIPTCVPSYVEAVDHDDNFPFEMSPSYDGYLSGSDISYRLHKSHSQILPNKTSDMTIGSPSSLPVMQRAPHSSTSLHSKSPSSFILHFPKLHKKHHHHHNHGKNPSQDGSK